MAEEDPHAEAYAALAEKLAHIPAGELVIFTPEEVSDIREIVTWWRRFKGAAAIGGLFGSIMKWGLVAAAFIAAAKAGLLDWLGVGGGL